MIELPTITSSGVANFSTNARPTECPTPRRFCEKWGTGDVEAASQAVQSE
jgi:hypothetical protein